MTQLATTPTLILLLDTTAPTRPCYRLHADVYSVRDRIIWIIDMITPPIRPRPSPPHQRSCLTRQTKRRRSRKVQREALARTRPPRGPEDLARVMFIQADRKRR